MKEPDPILILDNDRNIIAQYDPTLNAGYDENGKYVRAIDREGSYQHSMQELDLARLEGRITPAQFTEYVGWMKEARDSYLTSQQEYLDNEQALEIGLGDIIGEYPHHEEVMGEMRVAYNLTNQDFRQASRIADNQRALRVLDKQSKTLEGIASNLNK